MSPERKPTRSVRQPTAPQAIETGVVFEANPDSQVTPKKADGSLNTRGFQLLAARAEVAILTGTNEEIAKARLGEEYEAFSTLTVAEKRDEYKRLRVEVEQVATRSAFLFTLACYADVARDSSNGPVGDLVQMEVQHREREFDQSPLPSKLLQIERLKSETQGMLIAKFPLYLSFWEEVSKRNGVNPEETRVEIANLQEKFDNASRRAQSGISKTLRAQVEVADTTRFHAYLEMYAKLFQERSGGDFETADLPTPEEFRKSFTEVDLKRKGHIINELQSKTIVLLTSGATE